MCSVAVLLITLLSFSGLYAHHEAIFGPQSATLISKKRFVSTQYYFTNEGTSPVPLSHSHIGILSVGTSVSRQWSLSATLPFEAERGEEKADGLQDLVLAIRYFPELGPRKWLIATFTLEPPTGNLEHDAVGLGGGVIYGTEWRNWSVIGYGLERTESSLEEGEKRGNRLFLGGGLAYESWGLPFSPQLGVSWEHAGRSREDGRLMDSSNSSVLMLHPTLAREFHSFNTFLGLSLPVAQRSGDEAWQRFRVAVGVVWGF